MKVVNKLLIVLVVIVTALALSGSAVADTKNVEISVRDFSLQLKTSKVKARNIPVMATLKMSHGFVAGVPSRATLTFKFWNAPITVRENGLLHKVHAFDLFYKTRISPGAVMKSESCRPPEGTSPIDGYGGICDPQTYDPTYKEVETKRLATHDITSQYYDLTSISKRWKSKWLRKNQSARYSVLATYPRCLPLDQTDISLRPSAAASWPWPCQPGSIDIGTTFVLKSSKGWQGDGGVGFYSNSLYVSPSP